LHETIEGDGETDVQAVLSQFLLYSGKVLGFASAFLLSMLFSFLIVLDLPNLRRSVHSLRHSKLRFAYCEVAPSLFRFSHLLGKALGGGIVPLSAVVADAAVLGVIRPGEHGSTFGGNPLACAVGQQVVEMLASGEFQTRAQALGEHLEQALEALVGAGVTGIRVAGLWAGVDIDPAYGTGREIAERLLHRGVLVKDTHGQTIRIAPPLVVRATELDWAVEQLRLVLAG
jgi:acetylornithine/succinyldiaminopimelate/putrescine aminotransferase